MKYNIIIAKLTAILFGYDMDAIGNFGYDIAWQNSYQHVTGTIGIVAGLIALAFVVTAMVKQIREVKGYH